MEHINFKDLDIHEFGTTIQTAGLIWSGQNGLSFITQFPGNSEDLSQLKRMPMDLADWETLLRQTDLLETEILALDPSNRVVKAIYRRTQRSIDSYMQWAVWRRDNFACQYCGKNNVPLSIDHIDLWELGGATIEANLVSACKPCNKHRGRIPYEEWIKSPYYKQISHNLPESVKAANEALVATLPDLISKRVIHIRTR